MFYIVSLTKKNNEKNYGIIDTLDGVVEYYTEDDLSKIVSLGISVENYNDYHTEENENLAKLKLLSKDFVFEWKRWCGVSATYIGNSEVVKVPYGVRTIMGFQNSNLKEVYLPDSCTTIWDSCFKEKWYLERVHFPNSPYRIGSFAFKECGSLSSIDLSNCYALGNSSFANCVCLEEIKSFGRIDTIPRACFEYCYSLKNIDFGSIKHIEWFAFRGIKNFIAELSPSLIRCSYVAFDKTSTLGINSEVEYTNPELCNNYGTFQKIFRG